MRLVLKGQLRGAGPGQEHGEGREGRPPDRNRTREGDMGREGGKEKSVVEKHRDKDRNREGHKALDGERQTEGRGREKRDRNRAGRERKNTSDSGRTPARLPRGSRHGRL